MEEYAGMEDARVERERWVDSTTACLHDGAAQDPTAEMDLRCDETILLHIMVSILRGKLGLSFPISDDSQSPTTSFKRKWIE